MISPAQFRGDYPEFRDSALYPDVWISFYLNLAGQLFNVNRWGYGRTADSDPLTMYDMGVELFIAHNLVLRKQAMDAANVGGDPGTQVGVIGSNSVGAVSVSYDNASAVQEGAGHWNQTVYGKQLWQLTRMFGAGPVVVGIGCGPAVGGWAGPWFAFIPNPSG